MRTTLNTVYSMIQNNLDRLTSDMTRINNQISSGRKISKISDDPVSLVSALRFRSSITEIEQYSQNISLAESTIGGSESALREIKSLIIRAKELNVQAINPVLSSGDHLALATEIKNLHEQAVLLANSQVNNKYIFGGHRTTGYTDEEPSPFINNKGDGHWINGTVPTAAALIPADTLKINGITIAASADASATAKAAVINDATNGQTVGGVVTPGTGVSAEIVPATFEGSAIAGGNFDPATDTFEINGQAIFAVATTIQPGDTDNVLVSAINNQSDVTGVKATRNSATNAIVLTAIDGRNIVVEDTSAMTGLTAGAPPETTYGSIQLRSDRIFALEDADPTTELSFVALGLTGGEATTGESGDVAADGKINVYSIHDRLGNVRYAGDREGNLKIKVGKVETLVISENGQTGMADTGLFSSLKQMEDALRSQNFTSTTSKYSATDTSALLNSGSTGMERDLLEPFVDGAFTLTVMDHDYYPPTEKSTTIRIDTTVDTLESVTQRLDGIANISASLNADGELEINSDKPERYTFSLGFDTSNFLGTVGIDTEAMQFSALSQSLGSLDASMELVSEKISNFGAKANRIDIQAQIFIGLQNAAKENLSAVQDTDLIAAITELNAKEVAYQATLSAAAKTMQLSLVDFL